MFSEHTLVVIADATPISLPHLQNPDVRAAFVEAIEKLRPNAHVLHVFSRAGRNFTLYKGRDGAKQAGVSPCVPLAESDYVAFKDCELFSSLGGTERITRDHAYPQHQPTYNKIVVIGSVTAKAIRDLAEKNPRSTIICYTGLTRSPTETHPLRHLPAWSERLQANDITPENLQGIENVKLYPLSDILPHPRPTGFERFAQRLAARFSL